jgi:heterotetrameric sarcosine oxidase gamma subunit
MSTPSRQCVRQLTLERCFEFVAPCIPLDTLQHLLPIEPGGVRREGDEQSQLLHFAPRRWLILAPAEPVHRYLADLDRHGGGALVDVEGKWQWFQLEGPEAVDILGHTVNLEQLLFKRACGATVLFDCPAILGRHGERFDCWVHSSYAESFRQAVAQL